MAALVAATAALLLTGALTAPAGADTPSRVTLPDPNLGPAPSDGTASPAGPQLTMALRVYLSGQNPQAEAAAALAVSDPRGPAYARYLTPDRYQQAFGPSAAQVDEVSDWLTSEGIKITATSQHYITVSATVARVDAALDTQITAYPYTNPVTGKTSYSYADVGGFSVPAALGNDITTITGFEQWAQAQDPGRILSTPRTNATPASTDRATAVTRPADATSGFRCSQYWGQHTTPIPAAFGHTSAPTELCGYTVSQLRSAYGISASPYTGKGATIAVVLDGYSPTMLADANRFFAGQGVPGFAPGQYTEDMGGDSEPAGALGASCDNEPDQPEEALDVETAHIAAPDAHVVYMGTDCAGDVEQNFLDTMTNIVDHHLADVVTDSYSIGESQFSPAAGAGA